MCPRGLPHLQISWKLRPTIDTLEEIIIQINDLRGHAVLAGHLMADPLSLATARRLSDLGVAGCKPTAAVHFSPSFCPIAGLWACKSGKNCPRWGRFSLSAPQVRQPPSRFQRKDIAAKALGETPLPPELSLIPPQLKAIPPQLNKPAPVHASGSDPRRAYISCASAAMER